MTTKYFILGGIIFCSLSCSNESAQAARGVNKEGTPSIDLSLAKRESPIQSPVKSFGDYTNVQSDGEHQWGYTLEIWRQDNNIYGLLAGSSSPMLVGDPPTGILVEQVFDERSGKLSFRTKLPSFTYAFDGALKKNLLTGRLLNTTTNKTEQIVLKRTRGPNSELMDDFANYEDWKEYAERILKFRGPRS